MVMVAPQKEAVRGATYDLLGHRGPDEFHHLPQDAYASLNDDDRRNIHQKVLGWQQH